MKNEINPQTLFPESKEDKYYRLAHKRNGFRKKSEICFILSHFLCPTWQRENRKLAIMCGGVPQLKEDYSHMPSNEWYFTEERLERYTSGEQDYRLIVGRSTMFSAFLVQGGELSVRKEAAKKLRRTLINEFLAPGTSIITYKYSKDSLVVAVMFYFPISTDALVEIQRCIVQRAMFNINNNQIGVEALTIEGQLIALPFGAIGSNAGHRDILNNSTFQPIKNLMSYSESHRGFCVNTDWLKDKKFTPPPTDTSSTKSQKTMPKETPTYTAAIRIAEIESILHLKTASLHKIMLLMLLCSELYGVGDSKAFSVSVSTICTITGLSTITVKRGIANLSDKHFIERHDPLAVKATVIGKTTKGPDGTTYSLGAAFYQSLSTATPVSSEDFELKYTHEAIPDELKVHIDVLLNYVKREFLP